MDSSLLSPVEALNRHFDLPQELPENTAQSPARQVENFHGVVIGDFGLLVASDRIVSEIFETLPMCALPNTPPWIHAMANQRGNIIPIFDLALLLGLPKKETSNRTYYLVIGQNENAFGMLLDYLPEKVMLGPEDTLDSRPPIPDMLEPFIKRSFKRSGRIWLEWEPLDFITSIAQRSDVY